MIYPFKLEEMETEELKKEFTKQVMKDEVDIDKCMACEFELAKRGELVWN